MTIEIAQDVENERKIALKILYLRLTTVAGAEMCVGWRAAVVLCVENVAGNAF
jgi:hypothetical protein